MTRRKFWLVSILILSALPAYAESVNIAVTDTDGKPAPNAVVALVSGTSSTSALSLVPAEAIIDQRHETFIPLVSLIRKGGRVIFTNHDTTTHQVYSFSTIKKFEFQIDQGERSKPVVFDQVGVAAIGCNIHDQMITYVYVTDSPFAAVSDANGHVQFDVPAGTYQLNTWQPHLIPGKPAPSQAVTVSASSVNVVVKLPLLADPMAGAHPMHMGNY